MNQNVKDKIIASVMGFKLPAYDEIPDIGLFLEQTTQYISEFFKDFESITVTSSMISNYVKKGIVANPVKKQYGRNQIAYLIFIVVAKTVLSLEDIQLMISIQKQTYTEKRAYEYFAREFENILFYVFGAKEKLDVVATEESDEKTMLRNMVITVAHKMYLDKLFSVLQQEKNEE